MFKHLAPGLAGLAVASAAHAQQPPAAPPSCADPAYRQLDFWVGDWDLESVDGKGQVRHAANHITKDEYGGCVIAEHFSQPAIGYVGGSYSIYDSASRQWRQTWVDNQGGVFVLVGGPVSGQPYVFELRTVDPPAPGRPVQRMIWQDVTADRLTWRWQTLQPDGSWADSWVLHYRHAQKSP